MNHLESCICEHQGREWSEVVGSVVEEQTIVLHTAVTVHPLPTVILPLEESSVVDHALCGCSAVEGVVRGVHTTQPVHADAQGVAVRVLELRWEVVK